mgnify:CR=1 FL=1
MENTEMKEQITLNGKTMSAEEFEKSEFKNVRITYKNEMNY